MAVVQNISASDNTTAVTGLASAVTFASPVTAGNVIVGFVLLGATSSLISATYTPALGLTPVTIANYYAGAATNANFQAFYIKVTTSGTFSLNATWSASGNYPALYMEERNDISFSNPFTAGNSAFQTTTFGTGTDAVTSGSTPTLSTPIGVLLGFARGALGAPGPTAAGTGFTDEGYFWSYGGVFPNMLRVEWKALTSTAAVASTFTNSGASVVFDVGAVAFNGLGPTITTQPTNQSALIGQTATFSVTASGATSYQWRSGSVALKGTPTTGSNSSSSSNPVLNVPTGATSGDEYVVSIEYYNSPGTITAPAGFTQIATASSGVANIYTYRRAYTGTEGATFTWTPTTQRPWAGICAIVTNGVYVTANASAQTNGFLSGGSNSAGATGSVTPTSTNQFVLAFCDTQTDVGAITASITDPTGFTRSVFNDSGQGLAMSLAYKTETSSSAVSYSYGSSWSAGVNCWTAGAAVVYQSGNPISGATNFSRVTPAILNSAYGNGAGATSITTTAINTTTGSTFVICNPSSLQNTPTDSKGNVYTLIGQSALTANSFRVNVYACFSGIGGVGHTATATYTSSGNRYVSFHELSSGTTVDITAIGVQAASPYSATTAALSYTNELAMLFGVQDYSTGGAYTLAETTGFSTLLNVADAGGSYDGYLFGYKSLSSTSAITPTWTSTVSPTRSGASVVIVFGGLSSSSYTTGTLASSNNGTLYAVDCTNSAGTTTSNTVRLLVSSNGVGRLGMFDPEMRILSWF